MNERVPGNERAFTVRPAGGIPFPQLVCIGASGGQSQAFPVSAWARPAAALLELARAPPRATVRNPARDSVAALAPAPTPTHAHPCTRCHAGPKPGPGADPTEPGSHAPGWYICTRAGWWVCRAPRRHRRPRSRRPCNRNRKAGRGIGTGSCVWRSPRPGGLGKETPSEPWTRSCHPEALGDQGWRPGTVPSQRCTAVHGPSLHVPRGQGGIRPQEGRRADGWVGEALSASPGLAGS